MTKMRNFFVASVFAAVAAWGVDASPQACSGCSAGKLMLQCDYYVKQRGDVSKSGFCEQYADAIDSDGTHAKAAWYYLLGQKPEKAQRSAIAALEEGQTYAAEYAAEASVIFREYEAARKYMKMLPKDFSKKEHFRKNIELLSRIYPTADFTPIE